MLADAWPTFALEIRTPRLTLRLPTEGELPALAEVAADGIHDPDERPFLTPWTETTPENRARAGVLTLAFDHLGATDATSEVFPDNAGSQGVPRRLGYRHDGISRDARGDEALV